MYVRNENFNKWDQQLTKYAEEKVLDNTEIKNTQSDIERKKTRKKSSSYLWDRIKWCNITRSSRTEEEGTQKKYLKCHKIPDNIPSLIKTNKPADWKSLTKFKKENHNENHTETSKSRRTLSKEEEI